MTDQETILQRYQAALRDIADTLSFAQLAMLQAETKESMVHALMVPLIGSQEELSEP